MGKSKMASRSIKFGTLNVSGCIQLRPTYP